MPDLNVLAIDLGGSHAACALVSDGVVLQRSEVRVDRGDTLGDVLPAIGAALHPLLPKAGVRRENCQAVVLGFCGIVNSRENRVLATNEKFDDANGLNLNDWFTREFDLPFLLENDARLALLGEQAFGAARGAEDAVMITLGTGLGGAAMLQGRLLKSKNGLAGMIGGHFPICLQGELCTCGNRGCAEAEGSTVVLSRLYQAHSAGAHAALRGKCGFGFAELFQALDAGDQSARAVLEYCLQVWSALTVAHIHAYDPEVVVFGGSVMKREADILPRVQEYVNAHAWTPGRKVPVRAAALGPDAALLGAIPLVKMTL